MPRGRRISAEKKAEIARLYDEGVPRMEIAERVGVGYSSVYELTYKREPRYVEPKFKRFEKPQLKVGKWYTFRDVSDEGTGRKHSTRFKKMKLLEIHKWHALFVSQAGIRRCYQWFDINKNMV